MARIVYGINPVVEILSSRPERVMCIHYARGGGDAVRRVLQRGTAGGVECREEERKRLDEMAETTKHQGVVAVVTDFSYSSPGDIVKAWKKSNEKAFIVVLDGIQDPRNLGAVIRSAEAAGVHGIIIPRNRAAGVTAAVEKTSAGAVEHIRIARVTNIARTLDDLKRDGLWVTGMEAEGEMSLYDADLDMDIALVIGGEERGIRPLVRKKCDFLLSIPMRGRVNSLNASVSASIAMYEVLRQRRGSPSRRRNNHL